jgi:hypothetical protein
MICGGPRNAVVVNDYYGCIIVYLGITFCVYGQESFQFHLVVLL